nr:hypothetical protein Iba_chr07aCG5740 [Ipomoea batatas]
MGEAILRREEYLRKVADMPNFSLGLTPPLGEEATWDNVVKLSTQYQEVGATFPQAASPSSEHQEEEQMEVCEKDVALEERGGGVEIVGEKDVVVEERSDGIEMVGEKDVVVDEGGDGVEIVGGGGEREERVDVQVGEGSLLDKGKGIVVDDGDKAPEIQTVENQDTNILEG